VNQLFPRKLQNCFTVFLRRKETVVLFGGRPRHGLKPVSVMRRTFLDCPIFHGIRDDVRHTEFQSVAFFECLIRFLREAFFHDRVIEY
jgi:hypothetical protein